MQAGLDDIALDNFEVQGNVLTANVELYWENHAEFLRCCETVLQADADRVILDLTHVTFIFSVYMGSIGKLLADTAKCGKHLTLRVTGRIGWLFEMAGFEKLMDIEVIN